MRVLRGVMYKINSRGPRTERIFNSDKKCRSYSDLNFGVTFFGTQCRLLDSGMELTRAERLIDYVSDSGDQTWSSRDSSVCPPPLLLWNGYLATVVC